MLAQKSQEDMGPFFLMKGLAADWKYELLLAGISGAPRGPASEAKTQAKARRHGLHIGELQKME